MGQGGVKIQVCANVSTGLKSKHQFERLESHRSHKYSSPPRASKEECIAAVIPIPSERS